MVKAQNMVRNPGFELYSATNDTFLINEAIRQGSQHSLSIPYPLNLRYDIFGRYCIDWYGNTGQLRNRRPDSLGYFIGLYALSKFENLNDTSNLTHSGMSSSSILITDYGDYNSAISTTLIDTLCSGCKYMISYYVYVTKESNAIFNNIGLLFNQSWMLDETNPDKKIIAKFYLNNEKPLIQGKWQKVEFEYVARGNEFCFYFGTYYSKKKIKVLKKNQQEYAMLIYIDDFSIVEVQTEQPDIPK